MSSDVHAEQGADIQLAERIAWILGISVFWAAGYFSLGDAASSRVSLSLGTSIDRVVPFVPVTVWIYLLGVGVILTPALLRSSRGLFRRTAFAYSLVVAISFLCFAVFPTTSIELRPALTVLEGDSPTAWAVRTLYETDPQYNLCPSLHVSLCCVSAFCVAQASRRLGVFVAVMAALVAGSVCTLKQHFLVDVVAGACLAALSLTLAFNVAKSTPAVEQRLEAPSPR